MAPQNPHSYLELCRHLPNIIDDLLDRHTNLQNVLVTYKQVRGVQTNTHCIQLSVDKKGTIPPEECAFEDEPLLNGMPIDIVEEGG